MDDNQTPSLRDVLSEKYDELEAEETSTQEEQVPDPSLAGSSSDITQDVDNSHQDVAESDSGRDPITGKFTKKSQVSSPGPQTEVPLASQEGASTNLDVPVSWRKEGAELFRKFPPALQAEVAAKEAKREQIWNQIQMDKANFEKSYGDIARVVAPYEKDWIKAGVTPAHVVNHLLTWNNDLQKDFKGTVRQMLANQGLTVEDLVDDETASPIDPRIAQYEARIAQLEQQYGGFQEAQVTGYHENVNQIIETFANEKDASGQPAHPYFRELDEEGYLTPIAQTLREANPTKSEYEILDKAYEIAAYSNPKTRQALIGATQAKRVSEMKTRTQAAKIASSSISGAPGINPVANGSAGKPLRELLSEKYDEMVSGTSY